MLKERSRFDYGLHAHRKHTIHTAFLLVFVFVLLSSLLVVFIAWRSRLKNEKRELLLLWEEGAYNEAFELSRRGLETDPMDYFLLTVHGFSSYQLAVAQINNFDTLTFIDECIWSLRKALLTGNGVKDGSLYYVLGKAYYYKGPAYADLSIHFLEEARNVDYRAGDIPEYLGLSYAAIHDFRSSVAAFTLALDPSDSSPSDSSPLDSSPLDDSPLDGSPALYNSPAGTVTGDNPDAGSLTGAGPGDGTRGVPADLLLLSIARSYIALGEQDTAKAYLVRCAETSRDSASVITARLLLGGIFMETGGTAEAEGQYLAVLEMDEENAEAHYQLGELYLSGGDPTRARAEWRRAVRIDPTHGPARKRLNM
jgi:tetratricopeptide (TPR) repeat protein